MIADGDGLEQRKTRQRSLSSFGPVSGSSDQLSNAHEVDTCFLLSVWILDKVDDRVFSELRNIRKRYEIIDLLPLVFEVKASILEGGGEIDDRLSDFVDLFLWGDLENIMH